MILQIRIVLQQGNNWWIVTEKKNIYIMAGMLKDTDQC